ncbi:hypothetical protein [Limnoglobus roseus]|uniref:hypothetical protein n=1 Tax=Limnoglobus roseus TaxID=2598579 RepID=UPI0011EB96A2|nr:hypothetical protein [Limnoglobus roseus]
MRSDAKCFSRWEDVFTIGDNRDHVIAERRIDRCSTHATPFDYLATFSDAAKVKFLPSFWLKTERRRLMDRSASAMQNQLEVGYRGMGGLDDTDAIVDGIFRVVFQNDSVMKATVA